LSVCVLVTFDRNTHFLCDAVGVSRTGCSTRFTLRRNMRTFEHTYVTRPLSTYAFWFRCGQHCPERSPWAVLCTVGRRYRLFTVNNGCRRRLHTDGSLVAARLHSAATVLFALPVLTSCLFCWCPVLTLPVGRDIVVLSRFGCSVCHTRGSGRQPTHVGGAAPPPPHYCWNSSGRLQADVLSPRRACMDGRQQTFCLIRKTTSATGHAHTYTTASITPAHTARGYAKPLAYNHSQTTTPCRATTTACLWAAPQAQPTSCSRRNLPYDTRPTADGGVFRCAARRAHRASNTVNHCTHATGAYSTALCTYRSKNPALHKKKKKKKHFKT